LRKKKEEPEEKINMKVFANFRSIHSQTAEKITFKVIWGQTNQRIDRPMD
jgi:hypothetical protein